MKLTRDYCDHCKRDVPALYNQPSHLLHLLLCISTAGLWAPIWIYYTFIATNNCIRCGSKTTAPNMPGRFIAILLDSACRGNLCLFHIIGQSNTVTGVEIFVTK